MQRIVSVFNFLLSAFVCIIFFSCSKSSSNSGGSGGTTPPGSVLFPLAMNDKWNYRLKDYDTATGLVTDSVDFTLTVTGQTTANGVTYYSLQNSLSNGTLWLANLSSNTVGSIDSVNGINYFTLFASGTGDSTQSTSSWTVNVSGACVGTEKLYAYYADTTLTNLDGTVYTSSIKNTAVIYDCSSAKTEAQVYFVEQGVGLVRYSQYVYNSAGDHLLQLAWVLESETLH